MLNSQANKFLKNIPKSNLEIFNNEFVNDDIISEKILEDSLIKGEFRITQEISYKCSAQCPYCMNKGLDFSGSEAPIEDFIKFYDKLIEKGARIKLKITGGEPTQPNVIERTNKIIKYAINNKSIFAIHINTNGYWPIPKEWKSEKLTIQFSLDGDKETMISNTGYKDIYERLFANFDFCKENEINFQIRMVVDDSNENFLPTIKEIGEKYSVRVLINRVVPVGGAKNTNINKELLKNILKVEEYQKNYENDMFFFRKIIAKCPKVRTPGIFTFVLTPDGFINLCPFMQTVFTLNKEYSIYNFNFENPNELKKKMKQLLKDRTCCFPNGFLNFWNSLSENDKQLIDSYINKSTDQIFPSEKDFYSL